MVGVVRRAAERCAPREGGGGCAFSSVSLSTVSTSVPTLSVREVTLAIRLVWASTSVSSLASAAVNLVASSSSRDSRESIRAVTLLTFDVREDTASRRAATWAWCAVEAEALVAAAGAERSNGGGGAGGEAGLTRRFAHPCHTFTPFSWHRGHSQ